VWQDVVGGGVKKKTNKEDHHIMAKQGNDVFLKHQGAEWFI
jgi:hypothetical protein